MLSSAYIELGYDHILDPEGYDHILFIIALCVGYMWTDWRKILVLVTAFTIGHSLTLALSALDIVRISSDLVETLIPITIVLTCIHNVFVAMTDQTSIKGQYSLALGFGLIHGLGFSNFFRALVFGDESIIPSLLSFNIGVELGQIAIVLLTLVIGYLMINFLNIPRKYYIITMSLVVMAMAVYVGFLT
mgnify:CR=1 FL=1